MMMTFFVALLAASRAAELPSAWAVKHEAPSRQECKLDCVLVLDTSCSITAASWTELITFVHKLSSNMTITQSATNLGMVQFGCNITDNLFPTGNITDVQTAIDHLVPSCTLGSCTPTDVALSHTQNMLLNHGRPNVNKVAILLTDGCPDKPQNAFQVASGMKSSGIHVIGVGVGIHSSQGKAEIESLVSSPHDYFDVSDWGKLEADLANITAAACTPILYECIDDTICSISNSSSAVPKHKCEETCGKPILYECVDDNICSISNSSSAVPKHKCEETCGKNISLFSETPARAAGAHTIAMPSRE